MTTKTKRAAALGYGLSFLLILPVADGTISTADAGHALSAYSFTLAPPIPAIADADWICLVLADDWTAQVPADDWTAVVPPRDDWTVTV